MNSDKYSTSGFRQKAKYMIDELKSVTSAYGLGNDGNEFKVITQIFLYKFINDKFLEEIKILKKSINVEKDLFKIKKKDYETLLMQLNENTARLNTDQLISSLYNQQNKNNFSKIFDNTLVNIAKENENIFSVLADGGEKIVLFENISEYVRNKKDDFCRAIINKLVNFSFKEMFNEKFDFYADIFEYLIKDYNTNSGSTYAEYFTPHAVAKIIASCLVKDGSDNLSCYDPSAGSGTLLMNLAHQIGEDKCVIYSQDISQKSSQLLRLNLILNNLVHSIPNIVQGNTLLDPYHKDNNNLKKFDYVVSNPPFKLDFSDYRDSLVNEKNKDRFFAGIPTVPPKKKTNMAIYYVFIQHIIHSLSEEGKAAIVVPTGFLTVQAGIGLKIRKYLVDNRFVRGVISMPGNLFADTGTKVSILFIDKTMKDNDIILMDASKIGKSIKEGKNKKTILSKSDEDEIINSFNLHKTINNFTINVSPESLSNRNYSFNPGQYFDVEMKYEKISDAIFKKEISKFQENLDDFCDQSRKISEEIKKEIKKIDFNK
jgi:type I restriction enzyme M protein